MKIETPEQVTECVRQLHELLSDPQPGMATWAAMYGEKMTALAEFWNATTPPKPAGTIYTRDLADLLWQLANFIRAEELRLRATSSDEDAIYAANNLEIRADRADKLGNELWELKTKI